MERKLTPPASASYQAQETSSESGIDRFSDLPDEVAHHILSFLNFKDLNRVGALSKRCRQFHLSVPIVDFHTDRWTDKEQIKQHVASLMSSFDRYLHFRGHNRMQRVRILLSFSNCNNETKYCGDQSRLLLKWIHNAVRCNVEDLDLFFSHCVTSSLSLPSCVFHSQSLRSLWVSLDMINSQVVEAPSLCFSSNLRYLSLSYVKIVDESVFKWISCCCKCLKELRLTSINGIQNISIERSSLESFYFCNSGDVHLSISGEKLGNIDMTWSDCNVPTSLKSSTSLKIFAPNLRNLKWEGYWRNSQNLGKLMSLDRVELCLESQKNEFGKVVEVLGSICSAKVLIMNSKTVKALYKEGSTPTLILDNIRNLSIHCESLNNKLVPALVSLLRRTPNLNILCIKTRREKMTSKEASRFGNEYWKLQNLVFIHQLKEVSIENSYGSNEIEFARYILEHAQNLKNMVIIHRGQNVPSKLVGMLSRSKKISTTSVVVRRT